MKEKSPTILITFISRDAQFYCPIAGGQPGFRNQNNLGNQSLNFRIVDFFYSGSLAHCFANHSIQLIQSPAVAASTNVFLASIPIIQMHHYAFCILTLGLLHLNSIAVNSVAILFNKPNFIQIQFMCLIADLFFRLSLVNFTFRYQLHLVCLVSFIVQYHSLIFQIVHSITVFLICSITFRINEVYLPYTACRTCECI